MSDYQGWTNYETWNVKLWLDNEQGSYGDMVSMARAAKGEYDLAADLKSYVEDMAPDLGASMFADLLGAALQSVNWQEIAAAYLEDYAQEDDGEEDDSDDETSVEWEPSDDTLGLAKYLGCK